MTLILQADHSLDVLPRIGNTLMSDDDELWYHDHKTNAQWERLDNLGQAEDVLRSRTDRNPWAGIGRFSRRNADGDFEKLHLFEVLGWADRVYVCGDISRIGSQWRWSSWPADALGRDRTLSTVGHAWYQAAFYEQQVVAVNDAVAKLRPALHAVEGLAEQVAGYLWLPRERDLAPNTHLRVPNPDS
ncbi:hypothetical protein [Curtobacterium sp. Leaf154]|uniref:hypothetical protein n=1 Tax=Curtobacterium sp. Leaf154 TaxID=1736277 RepID=UPI0006F2E707|nr:hypothetical protein [Curtobacterium sp. Leaf154]KQR31106.1 hypothetical protein ASF75_06645 [Curtobacterium sp. Leaf154]